MGLFEQSGQSQDRRDSEATDLVKKLSAWLAADSERMKIFDARSTIFLTDKMAKLQKYGILKYTSPKVLFWLRDLWQKAGDYGLSNIKSQMSNLEMTK